MARRVNKKFLTIVTVAICCILIGGFLAKSLYHPGPARYVKLAEKALASGNLSAAAENYGKAFYASHPQNTEYLIKQGDLFIKLTATDPQFLDAAIKSWRAILEIDPQNLPALQRMVDILFQETDYPPVRPELLGALTDYATRLHQADPTNVQASAWLKMAPVEAYIGGVATDPVKLEHQLNDLQKVIDSDPSNTRALLLMARTHLRLSETASTSHDVDESTRQRQLAVSTFDVPLKKQPNNPDIYIKAAEVSVAVLRGMDVQIASAQQSGVSGPDLKKSIAAMEDLHKRCLDQLHEGEKLLKPSDENYDDLIGIAISIESSLNNNAMALKLAREFLANRPDSLTARLTVATLLKRDPSKLQEAESVLAAPVTGQNNPIGIKARLLKYNQIRVTDALAEIRCDIAEQETNPTRKTALIAQIQAGYDQLKSSLGETPQTLKLQGRLQLLQGHTVDAVQTLEKAQAAVQHNGGFDPELAQSLAMLYRSLGQTGQALKLIKQIIDNDPTALQPRIIMIQLLLDGNDPKSAEPQLAMLERVVPTYGPIIQLRIRADLAENNLDHAKTVYAKLPELSERDLAIKADTASKLKNFPEAIRLVEKLHSAHPDQINAIGWLVQLYIANNQRDQAIKLVDQALAAHPTDQNLKLLREQANATTAQARQQVLQQAMDASLTPAQKELNAYEVSLQQGKVDEAGAHLDKAEQLDPNNPLILDTRFSFLINQKKFDQAQAYVNRLVKANSDPSNGLIYQQQIALFQGHYDQAIDLANQIIAKLPQFAAGYIALAQSLQFEGRYQEAIDKYLDGLERQNNNIHAIEGLINCYYSINRPLDAQRYIAAALQSNPNSPVFQELQIQHSLRFGDATLAITARKKALDSDPNNPSKVEDLAHAYLSAARYQTENHNPSGAQPYADKLRALVTDGMQRWPDNRDFFKYAGQLALVTKDYAAGEAAMNRMIAQPQWMNDPGSYAIVSDFYREAGQLDKSEAAMREALDKGGGASYRMALAELLSMRREPDQALALLEPMVETDDIRAERVRILLSAGRADKALPDLQALIAKNPGDPTLQQQLLQVQAAQGKIDQLMATATAMLAKNPKDTTALYYRGLAKSRQAPPDTDGAVADLQAVLKEDPSNVDARYWLSDIYRQRNDWDSAITQLQQALAAQPGNNVVRLKLIDLYSNAAPPRWSDVEQLITTALADPQNQNDPSWQRAAGSMWLRRGNAPQAIAAYQAALKLAPKNQSIFREYVDALIWAQQPDQAISLTNSLAQQPNSPAWVHEDRAIAYARLNQPAQAKTEILAALDCQDAANSSFAVSSYLAAATSSKQLDAAATGVAAKTSSGPRWQMLAAYIEHQRGHEDAAADLMAQVALAPGDLSANEKLDAARWASMLSMTRQPPDYEKAIAMAKLALVQQPDSMDQLNNLACMLVDSVKPSRPAEALPYSQHAYDLMRKSGNNDPLVQDTQGWVLVNNGQVQDGIVLLRQVVDSKPFIDAYYHLAEAYLRSNQPGPALTQLKLASQTLDDLKKNKQAFDSTLPARIQAAEEQAKEMTKMQASAPH